MALKSKIKNIVLRVESSFCKMYMLILKFINRKKYRNKSHNSEELIIVSLTSWKMRINSVGRTIESILHNSVIPDKIVLNLSSLEFPQKELDLPQDLIDFIEKGKLELSWQPDNTKAFKKFIPTLKKYPNDVIIAIDDDFIYPRGFIEMFIEMHKKYADNPLVGKANIVYDVIAHCGCASLIKSSYFGTYLDLLIDDKVIEMGMDDIFYTYCATMNCVKYKYVGKLFYTNMTPNDPVCSLSGNSKYTNFDEAAYLINKIRSLYHIDIRNMDRPLFSFLHRF